MAESVTWVALADVRRKEQFDKVETEKYRNFLLFLRMVACSGCQSRMRELSMLIEMMKSAFSEGRMMELSAFLWSGTPPYVFQLALFTLVSIIAYLYPKTRNRLNKMNWRQYSLLPALYFGGCIFIVSGGIDIFRSMYYNVLFGLDAIHIGEMGQNISRAFKNL